MPATRSNAVRANPAIPIPNRLCVLILQHPREQKEPAGTAGPTVAALRRAGLSVGLSWPNLSGALGRPADPAGWAVCYLGSAHPAALGIEREVIALDRRGGPLPGQEAALRGLDGVVLLDGSWAEAKALWWRNAWLLKLRRIVLNPQQRSRYARIRREPRREALSTLEAAALVLCQLDPAAHAETALPAVIDRMLGEVPSRRSRPGR